MEYWVEGRKGKREGEGGREEEHELMHISLLTSKAQIE